MCDTHNKTKITGTILIDEKQRDAATAATTQQVVATGAKTSPAPATDIAAALCSCMAVGTVPAMECTMQRPEPEDYIPEWLSDDLREQLALRSTLGERVPALERAAARYFYLVSQTAREQAAQELFSPAEFNLLCDAVSDSNELDPDDIRMIDGNVDDAIRFDGLATKWDVDGEALIAKLKNASLVSLFALCDYIEVVWAKGEWHRDLAGYHAWLAGEAQAETAVQLAV